jgi:hypothetical protein
MEEEEKKDDEEDEEAHDRWKSTRRWAREEEA